MPRIFISYKRADKDKVFPLKDKIVAAIGEPCWIDLDGIESDDQFVSVIMKAINEADIFLFMYSKNHAVIENPKKDWTVREINYAEKKNKRIVFVNIDNSPLSDWFEFMFPQYQQVDATSQETFNKLLSDLEEWLPHEKYTKGLGYIYDSTTFEAQVSGLGAVKDTDIVIPSVIRHNGKEYHVTRIGGYAFSRCNLRSVSIPDSVTHIGEAAFRGTLLTSVMIPSSVIFIGADAFSETSLKAISIPDRVASIGEGAFSYCKDLTSVKLPNPIDIIEAYTFCGCNNLRMIEIPDHVSMIKEYAFSCENLKSVILPSTTKIDERAFYYYCQIIRKNI